MTFIAQVFKLHLHALKNSYFHLSQGKNRTRVTFEFLNRDKIKSLIARNDAHFDATALHQRPIPKVRTNLLRSHLRKKRFPFCLLSPQLSP